ncbi:hypothetical protein CIB84_008303, partial [Bambusicola thoracicus]
LHETLALLTSQLRPDSNHKEEMGFLKDVFSEKSLSYLMKIHEKLRHYERQSPTPVLHSAAGLVEDVIEELQTAPVNNEEKELLQLLSTPHLRAMLVVHDTVAQKNFDPVLPPLPDNFDDDFDEESVKIVRLVKNKEPLSEEGDLALLGNESSQQALEWDSSAGIAFLLVDCKGSLYGRLTWQLNFKCLVAGETSLHRLSYSTLPDPTGLIHVFDFVF